MSDTNDKWKIEYSKYSTYCNIIDSEGYVCTVHGREKAELISRVPELAAEVETVRNVNDGLVDKNVELINRCRLLKEDNARLRQALEGFVTYVEDDIVTDHERELFNAARAALEPKP